MNIKMKQINYLLIVVGQFLFATLYAQTDVTVVYSNGGQEVLTVQDNGGLYFFDEQLLIAQTSGNVKSVKMADIQKLLFSESTGSVDLQQVGNDKNSLLLYPNPVSDNLYVLGIGEDLGEYMIFSVSGTTLLEGVCKEGEPLDISSFSSGIYFIKVNGVIVRFSKL